MTLEEIKEDITRKIKKFKELAIKNGAEFNYVQMVGDRIQGLSDSCENVEQAEVAQRWVDHQIVGLLKGKK